METQYTKIKSKNFTVFENLKTKYLDTLKFFGCVESI